MPLLKVKMHSTDVKITLSPLPVAEIPAHQTAELVARAFSDVPHAQKLVLLMKALFRDDNYLSSFFGIHSGGVSSYTITLMVIAFCKFQVRTAALCPYAAFLNTDMNRLAQQITWPALVCLAWVNA